MKSSQTWECEFDADRILIEKNGNFRICWVFLKKRVFFGKFIMEHCSKIRSVIYTHQFLLMGINNKNIRNCSITFSWIKGQIARSSRS
jgi:hypothetical protein